MTTTPYSSPDVRGFFGEFQSIWGLLEIPYSNGGIRQRNVAKKERFSPGFRSWNQENFFAKSYVSTFESAAGDTETASIVAGRRTILHFSYPPPMAATQATGSRIRPETPFVPNQNFRLSTKQINARLNEHPAPQIVPYSLYSDVNTARKSQIPRNPNLEGRSA